MIQANTTGCNGGKVGLGFEPMAPEPMAQILSTGGPMEGMYYKDCPEHARCYIESLPHIETKPYVVFRPLDQLMDGEVPACVVFLANADQISALVTLSNFDRPNQDNVKLLFGAGCSQAVLYALWGGNSVPWVSQTPLPGCTWTKAFSPSLSPIPAFWRWSAKWKTVF